MILVDTSIWIDHFNKADKELANLLQSGRVCIHPFIIGELACGNISNRTEILNLLNALPRLEPVFENEIYTLIENKKLYGIGLGFIDVHLLASALIDNVKLWTRDKTLKQSAIKLNIHK
jgi:predicted nucleic acid-binding protein